MRQRSGAKLSARTVGESLCISKSVEAHLEAPDYERHGPTNRMSAAMFSGSPHSTRGTTSDRTERQVTSKLALVWCGQIVVRSCQVVARAFAFIWSNSAWVIVPASRSCLADAI